MRVLKNLQERKLNLYLYGLFFGVCEGYLEDKENDEKCDADKFVSMMCDDERDVYHRVNPQKKRKFVTEGTLDMLGITRKYFI